MPPSDPRLDALLNDGPGLNLEPLLRWLLEVPPTGKARRTLRLQRLHEALVELDLLGRLREAWTHTSAIRLLAETGLPDRTTFLGEGFKRAVDRLIPRLDPEGDLYALLDRLDLDERDARWVEALPRELAGSWGALLSPPREIWVHAARLLAYRAAAVGLDRDLLALDPEGSDADSPFFNLHRVARGWGEAPEDPLAQAAWGACRDACRETLRRAQERLDERGVSTDLVYRLELVEAQLTRMDCLLGFAAGIGDGQAFAAELVRGSSNQHAIRALLRTTIKRLARKMVEHTGDTGEHYIALDRSEWKAMGWSAAGGGLLTAGTALLKYGIIGLPLAPLLLGLTLASNYTLSFFALQLLGFSLASKQPAMTAAALAGAMEAGHPLEEEIDLIAAITQTQVIAAVGNVFAAIPTALGISALWIWLSGHGPLATEVALHGLHANHPFQGWTLVFAAFTGVLLWMSSLVSGWGANWSAYRRLPEALAQNHRLRTWLGIPFAEAAGRFTHKHLAGLLGYVALGLLLIFVPMATAFAGIHLEVRHITLQAASLALATASLFPVGPLPWGDILWGLLGLGLIGVFNFSVSFALALWTAIRARDLDRPAKRRLWIELLKAFNRHPGRFLLAPPKAAKLQPPSHGAPDA